MSENFPSIPDLARIAELQATQLGQTVDAIGLIWLHHLKADEKERIGKWSEVLDDMRARLRDMMCDYAPVAPPHR